MRLLRCLALGLGPALFAVFGAAGQAVEFGLDTPPFGTGPDSRGGDAGLVAFKEPPLLRVSLLPETAHFVPGRPFRLVLALDHKKDAYSYWTNPGGPGVSTAVAWTLPPGFVITGPEWPAPRQYRNGGFTSYVLKGNAGLVFTVIPPAAAAAGDGFTLSGVVESQVCTAKSCNPVKFDVTATLFAAAESGAANSAAAKAFAALPAAPEGWTIDAAEEDGQALIRLTPGEKANPAPGEMYFYDSSAPSPRIDPKRPQQLEKTAGGWTLRLPLLPEAPHGGARLSGVIAAANGWLAVPSSPSAFAVNLDIAGGGGRPPGPGPAVDRNVPLLLLFAFFGGLILNIMPCVFPVIGLKIMGFAKQAHKERRAVFLHGVCYAAGVLLCFWTLAFLVITMERGWGAQLQSDGFLFALCHIFLIMSMNMAGVFEVGAAVSGAGPALGRREGLKRSFLTGLLATITSTPCSAPFLGTALAYALSLPAYLSLGVFTLMGLGFAFPYLALSLFPGWLKMLPKPGPWMETFRQAMCFPLFATTAYLFWTMEAMLGEWRFLMLLLGLVLTAMACWLYGKGQKNRLRSPRRSLCLSAAAVLVLGAGVWMGLPKGDRELEWEAWSPEAVARLRGEGRPVYVDFTARWCATCQVNKLVYQNRELTETLREKNVALLKADWTQYDDRITSTLKDEFDKAAVPVTVLYVPGEREANVLPEILTVSTVQKALDAIP